MTYKNPFYNAKYESSKPEYSANHFTSYKGYHIIERIKGALWDVVLNCEIVAMRAGLNGAKQYIDDHSQLNLFK